VIGQNPCWVRNVDWSIAESNFFKVARKFKSIFSQLQNNSSAIQSQQVNNKNQLINHKITLKICLQIAILSGGDCLQVIFFFFCNFSHFPEFLIN
jgi:hypothetical protein